MSQLHIILSNWRPILSNFEILLQIIKNNAILWLSFFASKRSAFRARIHIALLAVNIFFSELVTWVAGKAIDYSIHWVIFICNKTFSLPKLKRRRTSTVERHSFEAFCTRTIEACSAFNSSNKISDITIMALAIFLRIFNGVMVQRASIVWFFESFIVVWILLLLLYCFDVEIFSAHWA